MSPFIHKNQYESNFNRVLERIYSDVDQSELTPKKREIRRAAADADEFEFCKIYFGHIFDLPWNPMHKSIKQLESGKHTRSGFRKCGKSAYATIAKVIKPLVEECGGILAICLKTHDLSEKRTGLIYRNIINNPLIMYDYDINIVQAEEGYYIIGKTVLLAISVQKGIRSYVSDDFKRFKVALIDDTFNLQSVESEKDNEAVVRSVLEVDDMMEDDGLRIFLGNNFAENGPMPEVISWNPDNHFSLPCLDENGESTWPEYKTKEQWLAFLKTLPLHIAEGQYYDRYFQYGEVFKMDWFRTINVIRHQIIATITVCDPAPGSSPHSCFKALTTLSRTTSNEDIIEDQYIRREPYELMFGYIDRMRKNFAKWRTLCFEDDFGQWSIAEPFYQKWELENNKSIPIWTFRSKELFTEFSAADKISRLLTLVYPFQTGTLLFSDELCNLISKVYHSKDVELLIKQLLSVGGSNMNKVKLDGPDSLASARLLMPRFLFQGTFKSTKKRKMRYRRGEGLF